MNLPLALICLVSTTLPVGQCNSCINGSNTFLGAVFEPYTKFEGQDSDLYPLDDIISMISIVSSRFHRISAYANEGSAGLRVITAAALANKNATNPSSVITVNAAIWAQNSITGHLNEVMRTVNSANKIYKGTITGLIITSHFAWSRGPLTQLLREANNHSLKGSLRIGTRASNCEDLAKGINNNDKPTLEMFEELNFIICHELPIGSETPEKSAEKLSTKFTQYFKTFRQSKPSLETIGETGWPTKGDGKFGITANVTNMNRFWCYMNRWSQLNSTKLDFLEAFDMPWKKEMGTAESHFGWWTRVGNKSSSPEDFEEKIFLKYEPMRKHQDTTTIVLAVIGSVGFIALIVAVVFLYYKLKIVQNQLLSQKDIDEFEKGCQIFGKDDPNAAEDALKLPYDRRYEIPKSKFRIDSAKLLGKGAFGAVYRGSLEGTESDVAFKMTQSNCTSTSLKSLLSEIKIMIHVGQHPNVVCIIGAFTGEMRRGQILIATELCEKGSLETYLQTKKQLLGNNIYSNVDSSGMTEVYSNPSEIPFADDSLPRLLHTLKKWSYEIASGMEYIASRNVIHADLAARNVLITSIDTAKITDFGLSRRLYEYTNYVKQNQEPMPWRWMAVESLERLVFSTKSDVWAFGVTLFEMFSLGDIPYPGLSWNQDFTKELRKGLMLSKPQFASDFIYQIMTTCWSINSDARPTFTSLKESFFHNLNL